MQRAVVLDAPASDLTYLARSASENTWNNPASSTVSKAFLYLPRSRASATSK
ncbi:MAG: hypothetical protein U0797_04695 [Gemmataceae bacterium]